MLLFSSLWKSWFPGHSCSRATHSSRKTIRGWGAASEIEVLEERLLLFVPTGSVWPGDGPSGTTITYSYANLLDGNLGGNLSSTELQAAVEEALSLWASYAPLHFVEQTDSGPDLGTSYSAAGHPQIRLGHLYIDGESGANILAQADPPGTTGGSGDIRFDNGNTWTLHPSLGTDFLDVVVHEIGHALGLDHQPPTTEGGIDAVMNPDYAGVYDGPDTAFLYADDINGIRYLYGSGTGSVTPLSGASGDDHANQAASATSVSVDSAVIGTIESGGDADWFQFSAVAGTQYTFETRLGTLNDSTLRLVGPDGTTSLVFNDDGGEGRASKIIWTAAASGTFFLEVEAFSSTEIGSYTLDVTHNDDHGGTAFGATALTVNTAQSGKVGVVGDRDWFSLNVTAGQTYRILLDAQGLSHGKLTLYASDGSTALLSGNGRGAGTDPWLIWKADSTGTMFVSAQGNTSETGSYSISYTTVDGLAATTPGSNMVAQVRVFNATNAVELFTYVAYGNFTGGAHVALGDVNGDGIADVITGAGAGGGPHVRVISGANGSELMNFFPYATNFTGGVRVASGDVNGDGKDDVITAPGVTGVPQVRVFQGSSGSVLYDIFPYGMGFTGGVFVGAADVNGDGKADIITGAGAGGGPHVKVISGANGSTELHSFFAYHSSFTGGVFVAGGDVNHDGKADVITGPGAGGGPHVRVFNGVNAAELTAFFAYTSAFTGGVRVGAGDVNGDGHADILTAPGSGGGPHVRIYSGATYAELSQFYAYNTSFTGGVFLAGSAASLPGGSFSLVFVPPTDPETPLGFPTNSTTWAASPLAFTLERSRSEFTNNDSPLLGRPQVALPTGPFLAINPEDESVPAEQTRDNTLAGIQVQEASLALPDASLAEVFGDKLFQQLLMESA